MSPLVVGVDAGGTSTVAAVAQEGRVIRTARGERANPSSRGVESAARAIAQTIARALDGAVPHAVFVGAAGAGREEIADSVARVLRASYPNARIAVRDDGCIALRAAVPQGDGMVLISGTGSVAYAEKGGNGYRAGGYGYLLGDEGSGFAIGAAAVRHLLRAYDGRAALDSLAQSIAQAFHAKNAMDVIAAVYGNPEAVMRIAALAPIVIERANGGDRTANSIVQRAALELGEMARSLAKQSQLIDTPAPIVLAGGLLRSNNLLTFLLETRLRNELPEMPIHKSDAEPYVGALALAERLLS